MVILGLNLTHIEARKTGPLNPEMKITSGLQILDTTLAKKHSKELPEVMKVDLEYTVDYPECANIKLKGTLNFTDANQDLKKMEKDFKKEKKLPLEIKTPIYNHALYKFTIKALSLAEELNLPAHIRLPFVEPAEKQDSK